MTLEATYELCDDGPAVTFTASIGKGETGRNITSSGRDSDAVPFALGRHVFLQAQGAATDDCTLRVGIDEQLDLNPVRLLPAGQPIEAPRARSLASEFPSPKAAWMPASARVKLVDASGREVEVLIDQAFFWQQVSTPGNAKNIPYPDNEDGRAVADEPMTATQRPRHRRRRHRPSSRYEGITSSHLWSRLVVPNRQGAKLEPKLIWSK